MLYLLLHIITIRTPVRAKKKVETLPTPAPYFIADSNTTWWITTNDIFMVINRYLQTSLVFNSQSSEVFQWPEMRVKTQIATLSNISKSQIQYRHVIKCLGKCEKCSEKFHTWIHTHKTDMNTCCMFRGIQVRSWNKAWSWPSLLISSHLSFFPNSKFLVPLFFSTFYGNDTTMCSFNLFSFWILFVFPLHLFY